MRVQLPAASQVRECLVEMLRVSRTISVRSAARAARDRSAVPRNASTSPPSPNTTRPRCWHPAIISIGENAPLLGAPIRRNTHAIEVFGKGAYHWPGRSDEIIADDRPRASTMSSRVATPGVAWRIVRPAITMLVEIRAESFRLTRTSRGGTITFT